jgi:tetratricopeptide (TPR) repeat protein
MLRLVDPTLDAKVEQARAALDGRRSVMIDAPPGAGRGTMLERLEQQLGAGIAVRVDLPPLDDPDAPFHGLLQVAARLGAAGVRDATEDATPLRDRARTQGEQLAKDGRILLVWIPASWRSPAEFEEPGTEVRYRRAEDVLGGWLSVASLRIVLLFGVGSDRLVRQAGADSREWRLETLVLPAVTAATLEGSSWGAYDRHVREVRDALRRRSNPASLTPVQARLLVGLVALGESPSVLLNQLASQGHRSALLENHLREALKHRDNRALRNGLQRFLYARFPLPRAVAARIAGLPERYVPLLTDCIGDGGETIRAQESLRDALRGLSRNTVDSSAHIELANHHEALDGAPEPGGALASMVHWLEKAHHLGRSGAAGAERWAALARPAREMYWDRARSLSIDHHDYLGAAALYRECVVRFDARDAYSWHYLGYNLDRAAAKRQEAERAFRKAVDLKPNHPWYNGRLVTFLIEQARFRDAETEWREALERVDPTGDGVYRSPWLVRELHVWVVKAWLRFGETRRAREAFDSIPSFLVDQSPALDDLEHELHDAEEAVKLGESVYPSATPMSERWVQPPDVVANHAPDGKPLRAWYPGRIAAVDETGVHLALAIPDPDPRLRRLIARTLSPEEWGKLGFCSAAEAERRFVYVAIYGEAAGEDQVRIHPVPDFASHDRDREESDALRYRYLKGDRA